MPVRHNRVCVVGGDLRLAKTAQGLMNSGFDVVTYAASHVGGYNIETVNSLGEGIDRSDILLLGLPVSQDGVTVCAPFYKGKIYLDEVADKVKDDQIVLGGMIGKALAKSLSKRNIKFADYLEREELAMANAVPTAEGAIEIAMNELPITLFDSRCLIVGYGRIGKCLAKMLHGIGAHVTVSARSLGDIAEIRAFGYNSAQTYELADIVGGYDLIVNTVPHKVINHEVIEKIKSETLVIDLASKPGGVDMDAAKEFGIRVIWALSLPGKVAPVTAGKIICDTVINIINELGV